MKAVYKEWGSTEKFIEDLDEFWMDWLNEGAVKADNYWHDCHENGEEYCYGRNSMAASLYYGESGWFRMHNTWIPNNVWEVPNRAFGQIVKTIYE